uniref:Glycosyltransferase n=1 Tax=Linum usitatissimum TaxID=4006 RepID=I2BH99_LINUS|nr:UDP-glycosyltransferase 1 [Linum usitatissimum]
MATNSSKNGQLAPHAICLPFPGQGHINPMLKLAKLLHQKGFHITFVNTEFSHRRLLQSRASSFENLPGRFRFETIPDGLPPSFDEDATTQDVPSVCDSTKRTCSGPFKRLVSKLNDAASSVVPPVTCIVSDCMMGFTMQVAKELGIPNVMLSTASACGFIGYLNYRKLLQKGIVPLKDASYLTNGYLETRIDWIPGMEGIPLKYMPSFVRTTDPEEFMFNFAMEEVENTQNASALIINTFDKLERKFVESVLPTFPPIYTIGPLHLMDTRESALDSLGLNLWKEEHGCLEWLDRNEPNSVVYINFGSVTVMTSHQLVEFAWGLAHSGKPFLWVIRSDLVKGESAILPREFSEEIKERGLLVSWCPQEKVLKHASIGGFLTHCGWNSTLESLTNGVPMICWPFFAEQHTNCWFVCEKLGVGLEIDNDIKREEIDELVRELMDGEKGKEMKRRAMEWKKSAEDATLGESGLAYLNLEDMINNILLHNVKKN